MCLDSNRLKRVLRKETRKKGVWANRESYKCFVEKEEGGNSRGIE